MFKIKNGLSFRAKTALVAAVILIFAGATWANFSLASFDKTENPLTQSAGSVFSRLNAWSEIISVVPRIMGYLKPQIYLVLFLNNAEIRPGGGFIGSYAVVRVTSGRVSILETNGSENLDWAAPDDFNVAAPAPLKTYLKQSRWFFRDANWSPDFPASARHTHWLYRFENGREGSKIDGIVGLTPRLVEELLAITGPLRVGNKTFNAETFVNELQYHVEVGFKDEGIKKSDRKVILGGLSRALLAKLTKLSFFQIKDMVPMLSRLAQERQIMMYSNYDELQNVLVKNNWAGEVKKTDEDYLMVVDANLNSLKSDPEVSREITYRLLPDGRRWRAQVVISYNHHGDFNWKTTRYRTYTRIYAPRGSELIISRGFMNIKKEPAQPDLTEELGKTVFGGFISIEPQEKKTITLEYFLPKEIGEQIKADNYNLFVQKQLGTGATPLTVELDFGKKVGSGGMVYQAKTDLKEDREFKVNF